MLRPGLFRRARRVAPAWLGALVAAIACATAPTESASSAVTRDLSADFQTDSLSYTLTARGDAHYATIGVLFTNALADTAYFANCNGFTSLVMQKLTDREWVTVWSPPIPACLSPSIVVPPGARVSRGVDFVAAPYDANAIPKFSIPDPQIPGVYRLVWLAVVRHYHLTPGFQIESDSIPLAHRISNPFVIATTPQ